MSSLGEQIKAARKLASLPEEQLAAECGVDPFAVALWEDDLLAPEEAMLDKIADVLKIERGSLQSQINTVCEMPQRQSAVDALEHEVQNLLKSLPGAVDQFAPPPASVTTYHATCSSEPTLPKQSQSEEMGVTQEADDGLHDPALQMASTVTQESQPTTGPDRNTDGQSNTPVQIQPATADTASATETAAPSSAAARHHASVPPRGKSRSKRTARRVAADDHPKLLARVELMQKVYLALLRQRDSLVLRQAPFLNSDVPGRPWDDAWVNEIRHFIRSEIIPRLDPKEQHALARERDTLVQFIAQTVYDFVTKPDKVNFVLVRPSPETNPGSASVESVNRQTAPMSNASGARARHEKPPHNPNKVNFVLVDPPGTNNLRHADNRSTATSANRTTSPESNASAVRTKREKQPIAPNKVNFVLVGQPATKHLRHADNRSTAPGAARPGPSPAPATKPAPVSAPTAPADTTGPAQAPKSDNSRSWREVLRDYEPIIEKYYGAALLSAFPLILCGMFLYLVYWDTLWSKIVIEPQLTAARTYVRADEPEKALPIAIDLLRNNPDAASLLYFVAGLYLELDRPVVARFYLAALRRSDSYSSLGNDQRERVEQLTADGDDLIKREINETAHLADRLPKAWLTRTNSRHINFILNTSAQDPGSTLGYIDPNYPISCEGGKKICAFGFSTGNLWNAIATQKLTITYPTGGSDCCTLALDDPDLRFLDLSYFELLRRRQAKGTPIRTDTSDSANTILEFRSIVLIKHSYALGFAANANAKNITGPSILSYNGIDVIPMATLVLMLLLYAIVFCVICDKWARRNDRSKPS